MGAYLTLFGSSGLPTRSRHVSEFMMGLEKTKARAGEISSSARALSLKDMHNLYNQCFRPDAPIAETRWGIVRYVSISHDQSRHRLIDGGYLGGLSLGMVASLAC